MAQNEYCYYLTIALLSCQLLWWSSSSAQEDYSVTTQCSPPQYFLCKNNNCLPESHACDGDNDCGDNSDEATEHCVSIKCDESTEFRCASGRCIPIGFKCDRQRQCRDGSDEYGCVFDSCPTGQFACLNNTQCLNMDEVCDGTIDCKDGYASDERHPEPCTPNVTCPAYAFKCKDTNVCALPNWLCDGENDCGDNSDEDPENCKNFTCPNDWFRCANERCIPYNTVCNGIIDCKDGLASDERHPTPCPRNVTCPQGFFSCDETNICAHPHWLCDGSDDCGDKSDENPERCAAQECPDEWFRCSNHRCIPPNWRCDGGIDCITGEDEDKCDNYQQSLLNNNTTTDTNVQQSSPQASTPKTDSAQKVAQQSLLKPPTSSASSLH